MKRVSIFIASLVFFTGISFGSSLQTPQQTTKAKTVKKPVKKTEKKDVKKVPHRKTINDKPATGTTTK